jgi:hypothetical protein
MRNQSIQQVYLQNEELKNYAKILDARTFGFFFSLFIIYMKNFSLSPFSLYSAFEKLFVHIFYVHHFECAAAYLCKNVCFSLFSLVFFLHIPQQHFFFYSNTNRHNRETKPFYFIRTTRRRHVLNDAQSSSLGFCRRALRIVSQ